MNEQIEILQIRELLTRWIVQIELDNCQDWYDINKISEGTSIQLLNLLYDLNKYKRNFPAIDLGDFENKIAFQVTSRTDFNKYKKDIMTFVRVDKNDSRLVDSFQNGLRFLLLSSNQPTPGKTDLSEVLDIFDFNKHIINVPDLINDIRKIYKTDYFKFGMIKELLEKEFGNKNNLKENPKIIEFKEIVALLREGKTMSKVSDIDDYMPSVFASKFLFAKWFDTIYSKICDNMIWFTDKIQDVNLIFKYVLFQIHSFYSDKEDLMLNNFALTYKFIWIEILTELENAIEYYISLSHVPQINKRKIDDQHFLNVLQKNNYQYKELYDHFKELSIT